MIARFLGVVPLAVLVVVLGCGETTPTFDPAVAYTPESLASELSFRYNSLPPDRSRHRGNRQAQGRGPVEQRKNEATKEEKGENAGDRPRRHHRQVGVDHRHHARRRAQRCG